MPLLYDGICAVSQPGAASTPVRRAGRQAWGTEAGRRKPERLVRPVAYIHYALGREAMWPRFQVEARFGHALTCASHALMFGTCQS